MKKDFNVCYVNISALNLGKRQKGSNKLPISTLRTEFESDPYKMQGINLTVGVKYSF
jgi:hypothetical protein